MIRVLQIVWGLSCGGLESGIMHYYRRIDRTKVQFDFLTKENADDIFVDEAKSLGARVYYRPRFRDNLPGSIKTLRKILKENPDIKIIHIHGSPHYAIDAVVAGLCGIKVRITHAHAIYKIHPIMRCLSTLTVTHLFACSTNAGVSMYGKRRVKGKKFKIIKNAIDVEKFKLDEKKRESARKELEISDKHVVLHIARLDKVKNQHFLIEAFALALKKEQDMTLLIAGDGDIADELKATASRFGVSDKVRFLGRVDDTSSLYSVADVFVLPSLSEAFPLVLIEAQAAGLPCIVSDAVTRECKITDLLTYLTIDKGADIWADAVISSIGNIRKDRSSDVCSAGCDINDAAKELTGLYLESDKVS